MVPLVDSIFRTGSLEMAITAPEQAEIAFAWSASFVNRTLAVVALLAFLVVFVDWLRLLPSFLDCMSRSRANLSLEHSISQARSRNFIAIVAAYMLCLFSDRYDLYDPSFFGRILPDLTALLTMAVLFGYLILRHVLYALASPPKLNSEQTVAARRVLYTGSCVMVSLMALTLVVAALFHLEDASVRAAFYFEIGLVYAVSMLRTGQIFALHCNGLATILYLCALEILPAGILIFTSTL